MGRSQFERKIAAAKKTAALLREIGEHFHANVVEELIRGAEQSRRLNQVTSKAYRDLVAKTKEKS